MDGYLNLMPERSYFCNAIDDSYADLERIFKRHDDI